jgi:TatD DNase family protein
MSPLVDSHVHLQDFASAPGFAEVLQQARERGIRHFICNGSSEADWPRVEALAREHPCIVPCYGLHPWYVEARSPEWRRQLERQLAARGAGVGEIGLDRWMEPRNEPLQEEVFRSQLGIARQYQRPVMIHCLRAWGWLMRVLESEPVPAAGFLIHAYGGSVELIRPLLDKGAYFSFAGNVLDETRNRAREALRGVPLDRLLLETDAPDLLPPLAHRTHVWPDESGRLKNHPANLAAILPGVAGLLSLATEVLAEHLWENSQRFFGDLLHS